MEIGYTRFSFCLPKVACLSRSDDLNTINNSMKGVIRGIGGLLTYPCTPPYVMIRKYSDGGYERC